MTDTLPIALTPPLSRAQQTTLVNLVRRAARAEILPRFRNRSLQEAATKSHRHDLVTTADTGAEAILSRTLQQMFPHALIVGEEAASADGALRDRIAGAELCFLLDPLDGTWNFAHDLPLFGVIVAVVRFGKPVLGLLYDPVMDDWIIADETGPARFARSSGAERELHVSKGGALSEMSGYIHWPLMSDDVRTQVVATLPDFARVQVLRCSCHEYRMLARGHMDFCLSGTLTPWDHAAGVLICQQAGGHVAMLDGRDYSADTTKGYLLSAPDRESWERLRDRFAFLLA